MKFIEIIIMAIIASGIISAILVYLLERYKNAFQLELELFMTSLNKEFPAFSTQFSQVNQRRITGVLKIHDQMCEIEELVIMKSGGFDTALINTSPEDRAIEGLNKAWKDIARLHRILNYHSLYLEVKIYEYIDEWSKMMMALVSETGNAIEAMRQDENNIDKPLPQRQQSINTIRDKYLESHIPQLRAIRKEIEAEFRTILGLH
jgi:hypothetical protein